MSQTRQMVPIISKISDPLPGSCELISHKSVGNT